MKSNFVEKKNTFQNSHLEYSNVNDKILILKKYVSESKKITKITELKSLLDELSSKNEFLKNDGLDLIYYSCDSDLNEKFFEIYNFIIESVIKDEGNFLIKISPLKQGEIDYRVFKKYEAFLSVCYIYLNFTNNLFTHYNKLQIQMSPSIMQKVLCILNYFNQINRIIKEGNTSYLMENNVLIIRNGSPEFESLTQNEKFLNELHKSQALTSRQVNILCNESLYDLGENNIEADFANKYVGGGTLSYGNVQEEIKFTINPELIVSMCVCEYMKDNEVVYIIGTEQFSNYKGYGCSLKYDGNKFNYSDRGNTNYYNINSISIKCLNSVLLAFDAKKYFKFEENFLKDNFIRELKKAYTAFKPLPMSDDFINSKTIATGKWGCGVFNGDSELKFLIQYIACSYFNRSMIFTCFKDEVLYKKLLSFLEFAIQSNLKLSVLLESIEIIIDSNKKPVSIITSIIQKLK